MHTEPKRKYDLIQRTQNFAKNTRSFIKNLKITTSNTEDIRQLTRSSGSIAANYIEANDALSKKDFVYRLKICRKESKECILFLSIIDIGESTALDHDRILLIQEATELMKIFGAIITKSEQSLQH